jgi:hypothetical protein
MKKILLICALLLTVFSGARAQWLTIHLRDGNVDTLQLDTFESFYVADSGAGIVRLQSPLNGERNIALQPLLQWQHIPGKIYELQLSEDQDFSDTLLHITGLDTNNYRPSAALEPDSRYYWRVRITNEDLWTAPWYFRTYRPKMPEKLTSLAVLPGDDGQSFRLETLYESQIDSFCLVLSADGKAFADTVYADTLQKKIFGLQADSTYFIKAAGMNTAGTGPFSEMLAVTVSTESFPVLVVNAFDRPTSGNSFDFIRQHANALRDLDKALVSASNEAVRDGLVSLCDYKTAIYILGEESTADETFDYAEQDSVKAYLRHGGHLFVSGSEIAWDLDYRGDAADKTFCHDFLHIRYLQDAPNNSSATYYNVESTGDTIFSGLGSFSFDNGNHGSYNVRYPDVFGLTGDSRGFLRYSGCSTGFAGVVYHGMFPGGSEEGKVMVCGFPLETVYPAEKRSELLQVFFTFSEQGLNVEDIDLPDDFSLGQNYPNPFNGSTCLIYDLPKAAVTEITVIDMNGRKVDRLLGTYLPAGNYEITWNAESFSSGVYFYVLQIDGKIVDTRKMVLLK